MNDRPGVEAQAPEPLLICERDAAAMLSVCVKTMSNLRKQGILPFARIGTRILYRPADLQGFLERAMEIQPEPAAEAGE